MALTIGVGVKQEFCALLTNRPRLFVRKVNRPQPCPPQLQPLRQLHPQNRQNKNHVNQPIKIGQKKKNQIDSRLWSGVYRPIYQRMCFGRAYRHGWLKRVSFGRFFILESWGRSEPLLYFDLGWLMVWPGWTRRMFPRVLISPLNRRSNSLSSVKVTTVTYSEIKQVRPYKAHHTVISISLIIDLLQAMSSSL